jgi:hypothetical protein
LISGSDDSPVEGDEQHAREMLIFMKGESKGAIMQLEAKKTEIKLIILQHTKERFIDAGVLTAEVDYVFPHERGSLYLHCNNSTTNY